MPAGRKLNEDLHKLGLAHGQDYLLMEATFPPDYPDKPFFLRVLSPRCRMYTGMNSCLCHPHAYAIFMHLHEYRLHSMKTNKVRQAREVHPATQVKSRSICYQLLADVPVLPSHLAPWLGIWASMGLIRPVSIPASMAPHFLNCLLQMDRSI